MDTDKYKDATGVERTSSADWVTNNASITKTFATTILRVKMGDGALEGTISFLFVDDAGAAAAPSQISNTILLL